MACNHIELQTRLKSVLTNQRKIITGKLVEISFDTVYSLLVHFRNMTIASFRLPATHIWNRISFFK